MGRRVMGVDLALAKTGVCTLDGEIVKRQATIVVTKNTSRPERLHWLMELAQSMMAHDQPQVVVVEKPDRWTRANASTSTATMEALIEAWAAVEIAFARHQYQCPSCRLETIDPNEVKWLITGRKQAPKEQVATALKAHGFDIEGWGPDEVDALAVALAWVRTHPEGAE